MSLYQIVAHPIENAYAAYLQVTSQNLSHQIRIKDVSSNNELTQNMLLLPFSHPCVASPPQITMTHNATQGRSVRIYSVMQ